MVDGPPPLTPEKEFIIVPASSADADADIDLLELWSIFWKGKWFISIFTLACTIVSVYITLFVLTETYKSNAVLEPTETNNGGLSKLASLTSNLPIPFALPNSGNDSTSIISFLNSRTLKIKLIEDYDLLPRFYSSIWDAENQKWLVDNPQDEPSVIRFCQKELDDIYSVYQDTESSLITISWVDYDPEFASLMVSHVIGKLDYYLKNEYESQAKKEREFIEQQLKNVEIELSYWEKKLPTESINLSKIKREQFASQTVYTELRKQLEFAKINEVKRSIQFKVLDKPFVPVEKFKPARTLICALTLLISGFLSIVTVFFKNFIINMRMEKLKLETKI